MLCFVVIIRCLNFSPLGFSSKKLAGAVFFAWSVLLGFAAASIFFAVTKMSALKKELRRFSPNFALALTLMLSYFPRFFEVWEERKIAYRSRGGKRGIAEYFCVLEYTTLCMLEKAAETATALEVRGA